MRLYGSICPIYNREVNDDCRRCGRFYSGNDTGIECDSHPMDLQNILKDKKVNMTQDELLNKAETILKEYQDESKNAQTQSEYAYASGKCEAIRRVIEIIKKN